MRASLILATVAAVMAASWARAQSAPASDDAAALYLRANKILLDDAAKNIMPPSSSNEVFREYPPLPEAWIRMEKEDYDRHAQVRRLVHQAASLNHAKWPETGYLNDCRNLANEIADAAEYQSLILHDQPAAFQTAGDLMHLAELLKNQPNESWVRMLVAVGIEAMDVHHLMVIQANLTITEDPQDRHGLPLSTAKDWIGRLLDHPTVQAEIDQANKWESSRPGAATQPIAKASLDRIHETIRRVQAERDMAAMALAAHIYQHRHGHWPANLAALASELPRVPLDPWGDGKQTLGYVLIKDGLPNGGDRPLVYSRALSENGLFFRTDEPEYGFYVTDGSKLPVGQQKHGGQFRDVTGWVPPEGKSGGPTTQALP